MFTDCLILSVLRLLKPLEHLQTAVTAANTPVYALLSLHPEPLLTPMQEIFFVGARGIKHRATGSDCATDLLCGISKHRYDRLAPGRQIPPPPCRVRAPSSLFKYP